MALDPKDRDGDSEMASSADSIHNHSDGAGSGTRTPTGHAHATAASELSPPGSQTQQMPYSTMAHNPKTGAESLSGTGPTPDKPAEPRVAAWKSKRAQEEYQRAMEHVVDKDFNLDEFGDPFDERDLQQKLL